MLKNYFTIAWRNLRKNRISSFINIGGLAVGMAVAILIGLWIYDEWSFNKYHNNYDRIAQVMQHQTSNGTVFTGEALPAPMGNELQTHYGSNFKYLVMASWEGESIFSLGDKKISQHGIYMDKDAARMLSLKMLQGNYDALKDQNSILLSASAAKALFGQADPMNHLLKVNNTLNVKVTGVYDDIAINARFGALRFILPWDLYVFSNPWVARALKETQWDDNSFQLFAQIADNTSFESVNQKIINAKLNNVRAQDKKYKSQIFLHQMSDWHLRGHWENGVKTGGAIEYVWLFSLIGLFVLLLACINFMNLSTARSEKRAREVGIRKAVGSLRSQLVAQFYSESLLVVLFASLLAIVLVQLLLPWFNDLAGKKMNFPWSNSLFWVISICFTFFTGIIAGSYPALYLSSFEPVKVLKGTFRVGRLAALPRKVLVVVQFTISLALIIGTIVIYKQVQHSKDRPIGYDRDGLMMVEMRTPEFAGKLELLKTDLEANGAIESIAESSSPLTGIWSNNGGFNWEGKDPNLDTDFGTIWVSMDFGKTVGWQFKEGRDFSKEFATDSLGMVVNEAAVKFMGIKNPVGMLVKWGEGPHAETFHIVGVIKDMLMQSPYQPVKQSIYLLTGPNHNNASWIDIKLNRSKSTAASIAKIQAAFKKYVPSAPFEFSFADSEFAKKFSDEERVGKLSTFFAVLAIFISCLGLFGLASFVAEQRIKEIGVRKVLGATVTNLWGLLSKDFVMLVTISFFIASPLAWWFMHNWLMKYDYRTGISAWIFLWAGMGAMLITLITVSFQAIKAALANPVKSLRSE